MILFRSSRCARYLALVLIVALYIPGACTTVLAAQAALVRQTLVVFPFDQPAQGVPENMGSEFASAVKVSLSGVSGFMVIAFSERLPSVWRAKEEGGLKKEDVAGPFSSEKDQRERALKIASAMASDLVLVGSIDEYKFDVAKKQAIVTVTAELADAKTGKSLKTVSVTGRSPEGSKVTDEQGLAALAAGDAVSKTAAGITPEARPFDPTQPQTQQISVEEPKKKKSLFKRLLIPLALAIGIGVAVASGGSGGGGDELPRPPQ